MTEFEVFFNTRVREYAASACDYAGKTHVVMLGDSITEGFPCTSLAEGTVAVFNQGISGDMINRADGGLFRRLDAVTASSPDWVFLLIGVNDLIFGDGDLARMKREYPEIVRTLVKNNAPRRVCLQTVMPTCGEFANVLPTIMEMNALIRAEYKTWGAAAVLDTFEVVVNDVGSEMSENLTYDGLHLNAAGYEKWIGALNEFLKNNA